MPAKLKLRVSSSSLGVKVPKTATKKTTTKRVRPKKVHPDRENQFRLLLQHSLPCVTPPEEQYVFHDVRKWRFDFAWPAIKLAVEIDGGIFMKGPTGHRSISGITGDMDKLNEAAIDGWCVLRFHAGHLDERPGWVISRVNAALTAMAVRQKQ